MPLDGRACESARQRESQGLAKALEARLTRRWHPRGWLRVAIKGLERLAAGEPARRRSVGQIGVVLGRLWRSSPRLAPLVAPPSPPFFIFKVKFAHSSQGCAFNVMARPAHDDDDGRYRCCSVSSTDSAPPVARFSLPRRADRRRAQSNCRLFRPLYRAHTHTTPS